MVRLRIYAIFCALEVHLTIVKLSQILGERKFQQQVAIDQEREDFKTKHMHVY